MTREEAIKWLSDELMFLERPNVNKGSGLEKKIAVCRMAIDALHEQEQRRWIPMTERLPYQTDPAQKVLFVTKKVAFILELTLKEPQQINLMVGILCAHALDASHTGCPCRNRRRRMLNEQYDV